MKHKGEASIKSYRPGHKTLYITSEEKKITSEKTCQVSDFRNEQQGEHGTLSISILFLKNWLIVEKVEKVPIVRYL